MRVVCETFEEFLLDVQTHVGLEGEDSVLQKCIRVSVSHNDVGTGGVRKSVVFQASAVMVLPNDGEYLLQVGVYCGDDYLDSTQEFHGTEKAESLRQQMVKFCTSHGLTVRPGLVEI